jgi:hypothetical protein
MHAQPCFDASRCHRRMFLKSTHQLVLNYWSPSRLRLVMAADFASDEHVILHSFRANYNGYVKKIFPPPLQLEHLTSVTDHSIQLASKVAGRGLVNSLLLDIVKTEIYRGGA